MAFEYPQWMTDENQKQSYKQYMEALEAYDKFVVYMSNLGSERNKSYKDNLQGLTAPMTADELNQLKSLSEAIIEAGQNMKQALGKVETPQQRQLELEIRRSNRKANRELSSLENVDLEKIPSYTTLHRQSTDVIIDIGEGNPEKVGGYMSDRIPLRYMNEKGELEEGFFTQDYAPEWTTGELCERASFIAPSLADIIGHIAKSKGGLKSLSVREMNFKPDKVTGLRPTSIIPDVLRDLGVPEEMYQGRTFTQHEAATLHDLCLRHVRLEGIKSTHKYAGIAPGSNINQRNTAMSDIATLLGCDKDVTKSFPMTIMVNGKPVRGSFMKKADGIGVDDINGMVLTEKKDFEIDYASLGESCANLLITDYICGNIDRHSGNIFFSIENSKDGKKMTLNGVRGIDNDLSFGSKTLGEGEAIKNLPALDDITSIPRKLAEKVQKLDKNTLSALLVKDGIKPDQIDACWDRVQKLQKKITKNPKDFIVDKYDQKKFDDLSNQVMRNRDSKYNFAPETPFKHAKAAIETIKHKFIEFADKFKRIAGEIKAKLQNRFRKAVVDKVPKDTEYEGWKKERDKLKRHNQPVPEELERKFQERHQEREVMRVKAFSDAEQKLGFGLGPDTTALDSKADKMTEEQLKKEQEKAITEKRKLQGVKKLHNQVQIDSLSTVRGQHAEVSSILKKFEKLGENDSPEFANMMNCIRNLHATLKDVDENNKSISDMINNLLADQFADVKKAITEFVPNASGKDAAKFVAVAEYMDNLCDIAEDSRERQVTELNELMASAFKELRTSSENLQKIKADPNLGEQSLDYKLAAASFAAKQTLAGVVGNLGPMENAQADINSAAIARLVVVEHISKLETDNPQVYAQYGALLKADPNAIDKMADKISVSGSFKTLVSNVNTYKAIVNKPEKHIAAELEKFGKLKAFDDLANKQEPEVNENLPVEKEMAASTV